MNKDKACEEMARIMCDTCPLIRKCESIEGCCVERFAKALYNASYRKLKELNNDQRKAD